MAVLHWLHMHLHWWEFEIWFVWYVQKMKELKEMELTGIECWLRHLILTLHTIDNIQAKYKLIGHIRSILYTSSWFVIPIIYRQVIWRHTSLDYDINLSIYNYKMQGVFNWPNVINWGKITLCIYSWVSLPPAVFRYWNMAPSLHTF